MLFACFARTNKFIFVHVQYNFCLYILLSILINICILLFYVACSINLHTIFICHILLDHNNQVWFIHFLCFVLSTPPSDSFNNNFATHNGHMGRVLYPSRFGRLKLRFSDVPHFGKARGREFLLPVHYNSVSGF